MMIIPAMLFGLVIGFALGLTGGGGAIFAVPLLVYGLHVGPHEAVGVSLAAVGAMAAFGFVSRFVRRNVEIPTGLLFAGAGVVGAPLGAWLNSLLAPGLLLVLFSLLMLVIAVRMWRQASMRPKPAQADVACRRDPEGRLAISSRCTLLLAGLGLGTGVLSGLFGVGGGFIIVPALVFFSGMGIHRAVATSLLVVALVSASGTVSYVIAGRSLDLQLAGLFIAGGLAGVWLGGIAGRRIAGPTLQRGFATAMVAVALFVVGSNLVA